ncbi:MAG: BamA/TamA family outer membrane protein [Bacteroidetes bacterium]|nr:BamA/TamA family outer membrane protein [Bacteroidota bacterium]
MKARLENQLDDSMKTKRVTVFPTVQQLVNPPAYDSAAANHSVEFMKALLYSLGYYTSDVSFRADTTEPKRRHLLIFGPPHDRDGQRVTVTFDVTLRKNYKLDSIVYRLENPELQSIATARQGNSLLKRGNPYSVEVISDELDRLVEIFRNQGYYKFTKDDLLAERDTVFAALINPSLDPFERLQLLQEAQARQQNPQMNVLIKLRNPADSSHFRRYRIRHVTIYPDMMVLDDSTGNIVRVDTMQGIVIKSKYNKFKPAFIASKVTLHPGDLYRQRNTVRAYTNFAQLAAWAQVDMEITEAKDSSANVDVTMRLHTSKKQDVSVTVDGSYNTGDILSTNLFGTGINFGLNNRNVARQAIQSGTNFRTGVELSPSGGLLQTFQTNLSHTISFPRLIQPFHLKKADSLVTGSTQLNLNLGYIDRKDFYGLRSLNASWGWEFSKRGRTRRTTHTWFYSLPNIELVQLDAREKLNTLLQNIPNLKFSFNTGLVISQILTYNFSQLRNNKKNDLRVTIEESGGIAGLIKELDKKSNLYRFVKLDADYRHLISYRKSALAFRLYGGIGVPYGLDPDGSTEKQLPFFKSFYAGGPNSMRGWQVRQLGVGSTKYYDTVSYGPLDRFGDIQLEGNVEYRFNLGTLFNILKLKSAVFTDMGNVWYRNTLNDRTLEGADFALNKLYKDLAVDAGTSLRLDFDYFLIRFDWAYKLKNPAYSEARNGWFYKLELFKGQFQLGVNYPF